MNSGDSIDIEVLGIISNQTMSIAFVVVFLIYAIMSITLLYHWYKFSRKASSIFLAQTIYFIGSLIIFIGMISAIIFF